MEIIRWSIRAIRKFNALDIALFKLCLIAFTLFVAKLWPALLSLEWYSYAIVFAICYAWLIGRMISSTNSSSQ